MGYVYKRGNSLWIGYHDAQGKLHQVSTGLEVGDEKKARQVLQRIEARIQAGIELGEAESGPLTVARYAERWIEERKARGISAAHDDGARLRLHVLPTIGELPLEEVRPKHIRDLIKHLRQSTTLAPRSVRHVYGVLHVMFRDATVDELTSTNPCVLKRSDLPKLVDKDPTWRANAVFTRGELERLISDESLPEDRRVMYALMGLAGLRFGEAAALRWRFYDPSLEPFGRLLVAASYNTDQQREKSVKTEQPRLVPVHPVLAQVLAEWKLGGWSLMIGRAPAADDLIIPSRRGRHRSNGHGLKRFHEDLERIGLRRRRQHDLRRTFISLARADGARKDVLEHVTHGRPGGIIDLYTELPWPLLCEEVGKLRVARLAGKVLAMPPAVESGLVDPPVG
jgi:integrase